MIPGTAGETLAEEIGAYLRSYHQWPGPNPYSMGDGAVRAHLLGFADRERERDWLDRIIGDDL